MVSQDVFRRIPFHTLRMAIKYGMAEEEGLTTHICPDGFEDRVDMKVAELRGDGDEWKGWWRPAMEDPRMSSPHETPPYLRGAKYSAESEPLPADHRRIVYGLLVGLLYGGMVLCALAYWFPFGGG